MLSLRPVFFVVGILLSALAVAMTLPALVDVFDHNSDWQVFAIAGAVTLFIGGALVLTNHAREFRLNLRQMFVMTTFLWTFLALFGALPFYFSTLNLDFTDAVFESMSGLTTTGSTVITGLDTLPAGLLLWRGVIQWLGGLGIVVLAISVLPIIQVGGMQLFRAEGFETGTKAMPRAAQLSAGVAIIYIVLTVLWAFAFRLAGMNGLEATVHAMTTIATGGYSTSDGSIGHFQSPVIETITIIGMLAGGLPFIAYLRFVRGDLKVFFTDNQVQWYAGILAISIAVLCGWLWLAEHRTLMTAIRYASFNVVSIMTGTGYATVDYMQWSAFPIGMLFFLTFVGGCAGSTACGIKVFRFQVLYQAARAQVRRLWQPHAVIIPYFNRRPITDEVINSVLSFFFIFGAVFVFLALGLNLSGLDYITAMSAAATAMANVGPGLGPVIGPSGTFAALPDSAKWLLVAGMLVGRLEVFTVFVLFSRGFWRA